MCGICGAMRLTPRGPVDKGLLRQMRDTMVHRGPDDEGLYLSDNVGLGHRRLSIIDLEGGHQPMSNADGTLWVSYNGEIYNFRELRTRLESKGHVFCTRSDTEVILHAYAEFGERCVEHFGGMFAFALWDQDKKQLMLARDRLGIKPLYYAMHAGHFLFASEIKAILQWPGLARELDHTALWDYLGYRYVPGPRTMFKGIWKLQPGHILLLRGAEPIIHQYWDLPLDERSQPEGDISRAFLEQLSESVQLHLASDVPLGVYLSGGIDSSTITALMAQLTGTSVQSFCVGHQGSTTSDERPYAGLIAKQYRTLHRDLAVDAKTFWDFLPNMIWFLDEPVADDPALCLMLLSQFAKHFVTVVLSGEGADEILGGYGIYHKMLRLQKLRWLPKLPFGHALLPTHKARRMAEWLGHDLSQNYRGISSMIFTKTERERLINEPCRHDTDVAARYFERTRHLDPLHRMLYFDLKVWLPDDLLVKADKMTMAASVELRVPFLDHQLVEWAWRLPSHLKLNGSTGKYIMRQAVDNLIPSSILDRSKSGFTMPIDQWFREGLADAVRHLLIEEDSLDGLLNHVEMEKILMRHERGAEDLTDQLFTLVVLAWWYRIFICQPMTTAPSEYSLR